MAESNGIRVIVPRGSLLGGEAEALRRRLGEALSFGASRVVVDLRPVRYISANAVGVLVAFLAELRGRGGDLKLLGPRPEVRQLFEWCGLNEQFEFLGLEDDLLASFGSPAAEPAALPSAAPGQEAP